MQVTPERWREICEEVRDRMARFVWPFTTPIVRETAPGHIQSHGSGTYVQLHGATYLLTAEHVIQDAEGDRLLHFPGPADDFFPLPEAVYEDPWPVDSALTRLGDEWSGVGKSSLLADQFDPGFRAMDFELLFFLGYPGTTAPRMALRPAEFEIRRSLFQYLRDIPGIPIITQENREPIDGTIEKYDSRCHLLFHYPERAYRSAGEDPVPILYPGGISGTLLWDTKYLACQAAGREWSPDQARVCGLIIRDAQSRRLLMATKIEDVRPRLLHQVRKERAFINWKDRGEPFWEDHVDWEWAERRFPDLGE